VVSPSDAIRRDEPEARENAIVTALKLQALLDTGVYKTRSELAAALGLSRARVTQLLNLLRLPRDMVDRLVALAEAPSPGVTITERQLRGLVQRGARKEDLPELEQTVAALASRAAPPGGVPAPTTTE